MQCIPLKEDFEENENVYNCLLHLYSTDIQTVSVIVSMLASSVVDRGYEPWSGQTKDYKIGICCFTDKHAALRRKSKDWFAWNQDNVSK